MEEITTKETAFDAFAEAYDNDFTNTALGRLLRARVWEKFGQHFHPNHHVLELTCGTGEDAVWLAQQDVYVTATDGSEKMVKVAAQKASQAGVADKVTTRQLSLQQFIQGGLTETFDGAYSNFGGLNTINTWTRLAEQLAKAVKPQGTVVLVPMGPICPWEIGWYLLHGQLKNAVRRFGENAPAKIGQTVIPIWYPSAKTLKNAFAPWFTHLYTESLELWLPPSYLNHFVNRWPYLFNKLNSLEKQTAHLTKGWGDHYIITFTRKQT